MYTPRSVHTGQSEFRLTDDERYVQDALKDYTFDPEAAHPRSFIPICVLYRKYREAFLCLPFRDPECELIPPRFFGIALRRVFPGLGDDQKVRRKWHGRRYWGYIGFKGPECQYSRDEPGRPKDGIYNADEADEDFD